MQIWVDADACPVVIREILYRVANRTKISTCFVANQYINIPRSPFLQMRQVEKGFDVADNEIVKLAKAGDLVITSDIPLAAEVIEKGAQALSPRGELLTKDNIRPRLNMRDFMDSMRETMHASGQQSGGPPPLGNKEKQQFANHLDRIVAQARHTSG